MKAAAAALIRMSSWRGENHLFGFRAGGRFQEIMGCFNFGFWVMDFGFIQNSEFKVYHSLLPLGIFGGGFDNGGEDFLNA